MFPPCQSYTDKQRVYSLRKNKLTNELATRTDTYYKLQDTEGHEVNKIGLQRQTNRQTNRHTNRHTYIHTNMQTDRQTDIHTNRHTYEHTNRQTNVQTDIHVHTNRHTYNTPICSPPGRLGSPRSPEASAVAVVYLVGSRPAPDMSHDYRNVYGFLHEPHPPN